MQSQNNAIQIFSILKTKTDELKITQKIEYINKSDSILNEIYLHNWANAYRDKNTPLAKRFIENYSKTFHFTSEKNRGNTNILSVSENRESALWEIPFKQPDLLKITLIF